MKNKTIELILRKLVGGRSFSQWIETHHALVKEIRVLLGDLAVIRDTPAAFSSPKAKRDYKTRRRYYNYLLLAHQYYHYASVPNVVAEMVGHSLQNQLETIFWQTSRRHSIQLIDMEWLLAGEPLVVVNRLLELERLNHAGHLIIIVSTVISVEEAKKDARWSEDLTAFFATTPFLATAGAMKLTDLADEIQLKNSIPVVVINGKLEVTAFPVMQKNIFLSDAELAGLVYVEEPLLAGDRCEYLRSYAARHSLITVEQQQGFFIEMISNRMQYWLARDYVPAGISLSDYDAELDLSADDVEVEGVLENIQECVQFMIRIFSSKSVIDYQEVVNQLGFFAEIIRGVDEKMTREARGVHFISHGFEEYKRNLYAALCKETLQQFLRNFLHENRAILSDSRLSNHQATYQLLMKTLKVIFKEFVISERSEKILFTFIDIDHWFDDCACDIKVLNKLYGDFFHCLVEEEFASELRRIYFNRVKKQFSQLIKQSKETIEVENLSMAKGTAIEKIINRIKECKNFFSAIEFELLVTEAVMNLCIQCVKKKEMVLQTALIFQAGLFIEIHKKCDVSFQEYSLTKQLTDLINYLQEVHKKTPIRGLAFFDWDNTQWLSPEVVSNIRGFRVQKGERNLLTDEQWIAYFNNLKKHAILPILLTSRSLMCGEDYVMVAMLKKMRREKAFVGELFAGGVAYKAMVVESIVMQLYNCNVRIRGVTLFDDDIREIEIADFAAARLGRREFFSFIAVQAGQQLADSATDPKTIVCLQKLSEKIAQLIVSVSSSTARLRESLGTNDGSQEVIEKLQANGFPPGVLLGRREKSGVLGVIEEGEELEEGDESTQAMLPNTAALTFS